MNTVHWGMRELWQSSVRVPISHPAVRILDVGCGSGIWAKEIAEVLPRTQVMGVDLSPTILPDEPSRPHPDNLSFEVDDINFGLQFPDASFDIVNGRFLAGGISDWPSTIREMYRVLSGTGNSYIQLTEVRPTLLCDDNSIPLTCAGRSWPNIFFTNGNIGNTLGTARFDEIATQLRARVEEAGFVDIREYIDRAPVGNWHPGMSYVKLR